MDAGPGHGAEPGGEPGGDVVHDSAAAREVGVDPDTGMPNTAGGVGGAGAGSDGVDTGSETMVD